jgi:hypothetical protein
LPLPLTVSGIGIAVSGSAGPAIAIVALCFAAAGFIAVEPLFWTFPTAYLAGLAAAGGIGTTLIRAILIFALQRSAAATRVATTS